MRRRDLHMVLVEVALTMCCVASSAIAVVTCAVWQRRNRASIARIEERAASAERTCADASAVALAAADVVRSGSTPTDDAPAVAPLRVEGYGQSRTQRRRYIYRDIRNTDGTVDRQIVAWFPISPVSGGLGGNSPPVEAVNPPGLEERSEEPSLPFAPSGANNALDECAPLCENPVPSR